VVGDTLYAIGGAARAGHSNSSDTVFGLSLSGSSVAPPSTTQTAQGAKSPTNLSTCPVKLAPHWACLISASLRKDGGLNIQYRTNFTPSSRQDPAYQHLHVFTARPDGHGGTIPAASAMQGNAGAKQGSWVSLYTLNVRLIPPRAPTSGKKKPLDTRAPLLCVRVASGYHTLAKDRAGGLNTGNCVTIRR
jgi:hypothetical protein